MTVARFGRSGEIAQLIIDYVLRLGLSSALVVRSGHHWLRSLSRHNSTPSV